MPRDYWFKIDKTKPKHPMMPIWPMGYIAFGLFLILIMTSFAIGAYGYDIFPLIETWITIALGILGGIISFAFLIYCRHYRSKDDTHD
ncbi:MAG: hypothetical protein ABJN69_05365 [Hellea sp.]